MLDRLREVAEGEKLRMELSSCFATGMWLQHFDIDVFLTEESPYCDNVFSKLDQVIASLLIDTATCKVKRYNGCR